VKAQKCERAEEGELRNTRLEKRIGGQKICIGKENREATALKDRVFVERRAARDVAPEKKGTSFLNSTYWKEAGGSGG